MTKLAPECVRTSDPVIRSPARYGWTTAPAFGLMELVLGFCKGSNYLQLFKNQRRLEDAEGVEDIEDFLNGNKMLYHSSMCGKYHYVFTVIPGNWQRFQNNERRGNDGVLGLFCAHCLG